jgi:hypothetical protein
MRTLDESDDASPQLADLVLPDATVPGCKAVWY